MASALERKLVVVTGKGGVGKTTVAAALGLAAGLRSSLGCELHTAIANATLPRRFNAHELERIARLDGASPLHRSAIAAARTVHERSRDQQNQIARLRRRGLNVLSVQFVFTAELDSPAIASIGEHLARRL